jgi:hypothetical protein
LNFAEQLDDENRKDFTDDCVIALCEGKSDAAFLTLLAKDRGLVGIRVCFPDPDTAGAFGKTGFGPYLSTAVTRSGFLRHVKAVAVFTDNDSATAFTDAATQIPIDYYVRPSSVGVRAEDAGRIPSAVFLWPHDANGTLETLILRSSSWDKATCVEDYRQCAASAAGWSQGHHDKFRLRCVIAATCEDPECSTTMFWKKKGHHFSIKHAAFDEAARALRETRAVLDALVLPAPDAGHQ